MRCLPPLWLRVQIDGWPVLWLPLFLLWPLLVAALAVGLVLAALLPATAERRAAACACACSAWDVVCATRGIDVDVRAERDVHVTVY